MILIESSAWIEFLRAADSDARYEVRSLLRSDTEVVITEPVIMELLAGGSRHEEKVEALVNGLPLVRIDPSLDFRAAALLYRASARNGHPIRSMVDCLIAAIAIRHDVPVLHNDRDFAYLAEISPLKLHPIRPR